MTTTPSFPTLHSICFNYIKNHTEDLTSLDGVPYEPVVENLIKYLFTSSAPLNSIALSVISHSHSKALRAANFPWTQLVFPTTKMSVYPMLKMISSQFPKFITHLKIGTTDLCDDDIFLLRGFTNLRALDFKDNQNISDRAVSYLSGIASNISNGQGFPYLEELYLDRIKGITDKSLKFVGQLGSLSYVSLTGTQITYEVATKFLASRGFSMVTKYRKPHFQDQLDSADLRKYNKLYLFVEQISYKYPVPPGRKYFKLSEKHVETPPLDFVRKVTHEKMAKMNNNSATGKRLKSQQQASSSNTTKRQRGPTTDDFLAMIGGDYAD